MDEGDRESLFKNPADRKKFIKDAHRINASMQARGLGGCVSPDEFIGGPLDDVEQEIKNMRRLRLSSQELLQRAERLLSTLQQVMLALDRFRERRAIDNFVGQMDPVGLARCQEMQSDIRELLHIVGPGITRDAVGSPEAEANNVESDEALSKWRASLGAHSMPPSAS